MAHVLVTGGSGYIGAVIAHLLRTRGHRVRVLDIRPSPDIHPQITGDLRDPATAHTALRGIDAVIHCAAHSLIAESVKDPAHTWSTNLVATRNLLDGMAAHGVRVLVNSSTAAIYGDPQGEVIDENLPPRPMHAYGRSKLAVEMMIADHVEATGSRAVNLRYFNVAGAWMEGDLALGEDHDPETHLIPNAIAAAVGEAGSLQLHGTDWPTPDGTNIRDYIHVVDLAGAHALAVEHLLAANGLPAAINLGSGVGYSNREVLDAVREVTGSPVRFDIVGRRRGDPARLVAAVDLARSTLGWQPQRGLRQMISDAHAFNLRANGAETTSARRVRRDGEGSLPHRP